MRNAGFKMLVKLWTIFTLDGTITKKFLEAMTVISHACRGVYMNNTLVLVTVDFRLCLNNTLTKPTHQIP